MDVEHRSIECKVQGVVRLYGNVFIAKTFV